jgi:hypothetical protein
VNDFPSQKYSPGQDVFLPDSSIFDYTKPHHPRLKELLLVGAAVLKTVTAYLNRPESPQRKRKPTLPSLKGG